ncbi:hypothetical protein TNIN_155021 [Trichonephila inaurata madagascariensis]|uniref:Uncharacterized protein n=1 Tax=Trichonephila inaurata madagascariensis TaxID=2747483 RepID=A0A8X6Y8S9_9ARAC|nr:hypothetical protein TNIN_155021 [Trichonephila inaurata madagascariensis]
MSYTFYTIGYILFLEYCKITTPKLEFSIYKSLTMAVTFFDAFSVMLLWIINMLQVVYYCDMFFMFYSVGYILLLEHFKKLNGKQKNNDNTGITLDCSVQPSKAEACVAKDYIQDFNHAYENN